MAAWNLGFIRVEVRHFLAADRAAFVVERCRLEAPVRLELERARVALRAAEIEDPATAFARAVHDFQYMKSLPATARANGVHRVVRRHFVPEIEIEYACDLLVAAEHGDDIARIANTSFITRAYFFENTGVPGDCACSRVRCGKRSTPHRPPIAAPP
jgi:hypothetical protein